MHAWHTRIFMHACLQVLGFRIALRQLLALRLCSQEELDACEASLAAEDKLPLRWAQVLDKEFKCMWADHGDVISQQYSGSQALKGDLTRTGKRTVSGLLQDGVSSIKRCVQNNFADFHRQQVMECFHGVAVTQLPQAQAASHVDAELAQ